MPGLQIENSHSKENAIVILHYHIEEFQDSFNEYTKWMYLYTNTHTHNLFL